MSGSEIHTRNWSATHSVDDFAGSHPHVTVKGEVATSASNQRVKLKEANPQGINAKVLLLILTIETEGEVGNAVMGWAAAEFKKSAKQDEYTDVQITQDGEEITSIKIKNIFS